MNLISKKLGGKGMSKRIESISFLFENKRLVVKVNKDGTFRLPFQSPATHRGYSPSAKVYYRNLTARQVIEDRRIKGGDPVLTLVNGDKIRVFQAGDSSYLPALSEGVLQKHDSLGKQEARLKKEAAEKKSQESASRQFEFDWGTYDDWH